MARAPFFVYSVLCYLLVSHCAAEHTPNSTCPPFNCGRLGQLFLPFTRNLQCGQFIVDDCDKPVQRVQLKRGTGKWYEVVNISQAGTIFMQDKELEQQLKSRNCDAFNGLSLPTSPSFVLKMYPCRIFYKCSRTLKSTDAPITDFKYAGCHDDIYFNRLDRPPPLAILPPQCAIIQLPATVGKKDLNVTTDPFRVVDSKFFVDITIMPICLSCATKGGHCREDKEGKFRCTDLILEGNSRRRLKLWAGVAGGLAFAILFICSILFILRQRKFMSSNSFSRGAYSDPTSKSSLEKECAYFGAPVFAYEELESATKCFDSNKELGDGGYGTVYHGKLRDGREVAVKRLYENNCKRVEQFMNEIKILTRLRHQNLVTLYGCASHHRRELLLVYEFIPNGTVGDHLHGDRANSRLLTWPVRLRIAIETASAIAYLHASDIIHRDVKTNNILLDNNFCVKVADFGLSRLFPIDVSHISTAPQGTPGYVDPEYHQCYHLTEKSDVYSFGVVLVELISSMPAVDISRRREEINLSNLAIKRIQSQAFDHLVDPCLGFELDCAVKRSTIMVAELAFKCLQLNRDKRPSMEEVLRILKSIQGDQDDEVKTEKGDDSVGSVMSTRVDPMSLPESNDAMSSKRMHLLTSPTSVTDKWVSIPPTPNNTCV